LQDPNNQAVSLDDVTQLINQAQKYWKFRRFWFNEKTLDEDMVSGDATINTPDDFLMYATKTGGPVVEYSGIRYPLLKLVEPVYNWNYLSNGVGQPIWYAKLADQQYQAYPIPNRDYVVRHFYLKEYEDWDGTTDTSNDFTQHAPYLLGYTACSYGVLDLRSDTDMGDYFWGKAQDEFKNLQVRTTKENASGSLVVSSALTNPY
jgi:hypothetical protein